MQSFGIGLVFNIKNCIEVLIKITNNIRKNFPPKQILYLGGLFFLTLYNSYLVWNMKEIIFLNYLNIKVVSLIRLWGVVPFLFFFIATFSSLLKKYSFKIVYNIFVIVFLLFFCFFVFFSELYTQLSLNLEDEILQKKYQGWFFILYYTISEIWIVVSSGFLFWQISNYIVDHDTAKKHYIKISFLGNLGVILASCVIILSSANNTNTKIVHNLSHVFYYINLNIIISAILMLLMFRTILHSISHENSKNTRQVKISLKDSLKVIFQDKRLILLSIIVLCYSITNVFIKIIWQFNVQLGDHLAYHYTLIVTFYSLLTGFISVIMTIIGSFVIKKYDWKITALITPFIILISFSMFIVYSLISYYNICCVSSNFLSTVFFTLFISIPTILIESSKSALYVPLKEMVYTSIDIQNSIKGKIFIDLLGNRLAQFIGNFIFYYIFITFDLSFHVNFIVMIMSLGISFIWIFTTIKLSTEILREYEYKVCNSKNKDGLI